MAKPPCRPGQIESRVAGRRCVQTGSEESRDQGDQQGDEKDSTTEDTESPRGKKKRKNQGQGPRSRRSGAKNSRKDQPPFQPGAFLRSRVARCGARFASGFSG